MKMLKGFLFVFLLVVSYPGISQNVVVPLWTGVIPNYKDIGEKEYRDTTNIVRISKVQKPDIAVFLPSKANATGQAVVICPGGGYHILAYDWEGTDIAKWLNSLGVAGIVLKYRLPADKCNIISYKSALMDAQRAIRLVRYHAYKWHINPDKVGIMGFSAGGHLASTAGTHYDMGSPDAEDPVERMGCRPDFMILGYPVISMADSITHQGTRTALLRSDPTSERAHEFSNELHVTTDTPPAFLFLASDDKVVPPENSLLFYKALKDHNVPVEMHIFPEGGHGFSLAVKNTHLSTWTNACAAWLRWINENQ